MVKKNTKLVAIEWLDAKTSERVDKELVKNSSTKELMAKCISYGIIIKQDSDGIVIMHEDSGDQADITCIPRQWIKKIKEKK